jgi:hypothetical protein
MGLTPSSQTVNRSLGRVIAFFVKSD